MDCLIIGYNDLDFGKVVAEVKSMGEDNVAFRDLDLNFIEIDAKPYRGQDILNRYFNAGPRFSKRRFSNHDLLWPAIPPIATFLHNKGFSFDYINNFDVDKDLLRQKLLQEGILTIAITTTIYISDSPILEIVSFIRRYNQQVKIVVGGPYMSKQTEEKDDVTLQAFLKYLGADIYVFSKEGELALYRIIQELKGAEELGGIDNIGYLQHGRYVITGAKGEDNPLDKNPINYSLFPKEAIGEYINLKTSKSCPFECSFCAFPLRAERYVYTDEHWIRQQLNAIRAIGTVKNVFFSDDTFNIPLTRFKSIMRMMIAEKYPFRWHCFYRCGNSDEEAIMLMKEAGCTGVFLGIESANDTILTIMNKKARRIDYATAIPLFRKHGILTFASIFVGFPGETYESYKDTTDFIEETAPDFCRPLVWYCDTTTPIWRDRDKYGIKGNSFNWTHNTMSAREACDLMEESFMSLKSPTVYVPDPGFNFISVYYLLQRGFTVEQVKWFLTNFNNGVKAKILFPGKRQIPTNLLKNIEKSCDLNISTSELDRNVIKTYSGEAYQSALDYWLSKFRNYNFASRLLTEEGKRSPQNELDEVDFEGGNLYDSNTVDTETVLSLLLYSISYLEGYATISILVGLKSGIYFPIVIDINNNWSFDELRHLVSAELKQASRNHLYCFHILANRYRLKKYGLQIPVIRYAFLESGNSCQNILTDISTSFPEVYKNLGLTVEVNPIGQKGVSGISLSYNAADLTSIKKIKSLFVLTLDQVRTNPNVKLSAFRYNRSNTGSEVFSNQQKLQKPFKF
jgi:anaerobic magnesium-protoporphyrin IX monomethyl ester cyclase